MMVLPGLPRRITFFFVSIFVKLGFTAVSGLGFVFGNPIMSVLGSVIWLVWFGSLWFMALPRSNLTLNNQTWLRPAAAGITAVLLLLGIGQMILFSAVSSGRVNVESQVPGMHQLLTLFQGILHYNDAEALTQQGAENFLEGKNPYAGANV